MLRGSASDAYVSMEARWRQSSRRADLSVLLPAGDEVVALRADWNVLRAVNDLVDRLSQAEWTSVRTAAT